MRGQNVIEKNIKKKVGSNLAWCSLFVFPINTMNDENLIR